jgi:hypothetical protein
LFCKCRRCHLHIPLVRWFGIVIAICRLSLPMTILALLPTPLPSLLLSLVLISTIKNKLSVTFYHLELLCISNSRCQSTLLVRVLRGMFTYMCITRSVLSEFWIKFWNVMLLKIFFSSMLSLASVCIYKYEIIIFYNVKNRIDNETSRETNDSIHLFYIYIYIYIYIWDEMFTPIHETFNSVLICGCLNGHNVS